MKLYVITSEYSKVPLAEIRTDGKNIDWIVDNTNGKLRRLAKEDFRILSNVIDKSSHLRMAYPEQATVGLLRYALENGDIIEITTDGKTAMLNGAIIAEEEKIALMSLISSGRLKVASKANLASPLPIKMRTPPTKKAPTQTEEQRKKEMASFKQIREETEKKQNIWSPKQDSMIDSVDFSDSHCPALGRNLLYLLKYGE